jgi:hypothetical protein
MKTELDMDKIAEGLGASPGAGLNGVGEMARFVKMNPSRLRLRYTELYTESVFWDTEFTKIHEYSAEENARNTLKEEN